MRGGTKITWPVRWQSRLYFIQVLGNPELEADAVQYIEKKDTNDFLHTLICKINDKIKCVESVQEVHFIMHFFLEQSYREKR
jgi:hypothetical protein